jgi:type II secretory pathway component PulF
MVSKMIQFGSLQESLTAVEQNILLGHSLSEKFEIESLFDNRIITMGKRAEETTKRNMFLSN